MKLPAVVRELPPAARLLYLALRDAADSQGVAVVGFATIALATGFKRRGCLARAYRALQKAGIVEVTRRDGVTNQYRLLMGQKEGE